MGCVSRLSTTNFGASGCYRQIQMILQCQCQYWLQTIMRDGLEICILRSCTCGKARGVHNLKWTRDDSENVPGATRTMLNVSVKNDKLPHQLWPSCSVQVQSQWPNGHIRSQKGSSKQFSLNSLTSIFSDGRSNQNKCNLYCT